MLTIMPKLQFYWIDVFAEKKLEGNQLAVFPEAGTLNKEQMQSIAREMGLSESTFITGIEKSESGENAYKTRIFTTEEELPFAGHPTLGTSFLMRAFYDQDLVMLSLPVGKISVKFEMHDAKVFGEMVQKEPSFGAKHDAEAIAKIFNVAVDELDLDLPIQTVSTGNPFIIVPFRRLKALQEINPDFYQMRKYLENSDARFIYTVSRETESEDAILHARMIFYGGEDPATGSAAGPAAAWLLKNKMLKPEKLEWIEQGIEMKRPSKIFIRGSMAGENPSNIRVGGYCFKVARGELDL